MKRSVNWRLLLANALRMVSVVAMAGFVAWVPTTRTGITPTSGTSTTMVAWTGGAGGE